MKSWLRQHRYALRVALRRLVQQPVSSLANTLVIALSLTLPLMGAVVLESAQPALGQLHAEPQITLFLTRGVDAPAPEHIVRRLRAEHTDDIATLHIVPRDQARQQLARTPAWADALAVLDENPLPDAIVVTLHPVVADPTTLTQLWQLWPGIDRVQFDSAWQQRLQALLQTLNLALGLLGASVGVVVLATTFNTVRMQALGQREEIEVARLMGATEAFVRRPFLYLGAFSGLAAGLLAIAATAAVLSPLNTALHVLAASYGLVFALHLPPASLLLTALLGVVILCAIAARWSVTRTTRS